jgi:hypothetical protein
VREMVILKGSEVNLIIFQLRVPVTGKLSAGFINILGKRDFPDATFVTEKVALQVGDELFLIYERPMS